MDVRDTTPVILIATASNEMRERWREALRDSAANDAVDAAQLRRRIRDEEPDLVLLDEALPGLGGLAGLTALRRLSPGTRILLLTAVPSDRDAVAAFKAGVRGYARRDLAAFLLRKAVAAMLAGEIWASRRVVGRLLDELTAHARLAVGDGARGQADLGALTAREREIALLIGSGAANKEIANAAGVTERTVKAHLTAIFRKLGVPDRLRLALFVSENDEVRRLAARTVTVRRSNLRRRASTE
jgi:two-component system, NarL family, nitrate/nitrite response regulator NarL